MILYKRLNWSAVVSMPKYLNRTDAYSEVDDLLRSNNTFLKSMRDVATTLKHVESNAKRSSVNKPSEDYITTADLKKANMLIEQYGRNVDRAKFFEERLGLAHDFEYAKSVISNSETRKFHEIVRTRPRNEEETVVLMAATAFLEPHEFEAAARNPNLTLKDVCQQVDNSVLKRISSKILENIVKEEEKAHPELRKSEDQGFDVLSKKFGILDAIMKGIQDIAQNAENLQLAKKSKGIQRS